MNLQKNKNFAQIVSDDSFTDPEDEDLADEMSYMANSIAMKDFDSLRQKPEAVSVINAATPSAQKSPYQSFGNGQFKVIPEISNEYSESPSPDSKFKSIRINKEELQFEDPPFEGDLISDRLN